MTSKEAEYMAWMIKSRAFLRDDTPVPNLGDETRDERVTRLVRERHEEHKQMCKELDSKPRRSKRRKKKDRQRSSRSASKGLRQGEPHYAKRKSCDSLGTLGDLFSLDNS